MTSHTVPSSRTLHLILDFDGTLTTRDTLHILGRLGSRKHINPSEDPWTSIVSAYTSDFAAHAASYRPTPEDRRTIEQEIAWFASLESVEHRSVERVEQQKLLAGVTSADIKRAAGDAIASGEVRLREGWQEMLVGLYRRRKSVRIAILSVNWSVTFIRKTLYSAVEQEHGLRDEDRARLREMVERIEIRANELEGLEGVDGSTGLLNQGGQRGIRTSGDKLVAMVSEGLETGDVLVYVGDSATDLECLLRADIGVCIRDDAMGNGQKEFSSTLERIGVATAPIARLRDMSGNPRGPNGRIVWFARDFGEIYQLLLRVTDS